MKTYTIEKKMSGTGSIHDISSDLYDRDIEFKNGELYAVVSAAFYGELYTCHRSSIAAAKASRKLTREGFSHEIIDSYGAEYMVYGNDLVTKGGKSNARFSVNPDGVGE